MLKLVRINERGLRVGEDHPRAKLCDFEIDQIRDLHDEGYGYRKLAAIFGISKSHVRDIVLCRKRGQIGVAVREVRLPDVDV